MRDEDLANDLQKQNQYENINALNNNSTSMINEVILVKTSAVICTNIWPLTDVKSNICRFIYNKNAP